MAERNEPNIIRQSNGVYHIETHQYVRYKFGNGIQYLRCRFHRKFKCPGLGKIKRNGLFTKTREHVHLRDQALDRQDSLREEMLNSSESQPARLRTVYNSNAEMNRTAAIGVSFKRIYGTMRMRREKHIPSEPVDIDDFIVKINQHQFKRLLGYDDITLEYRVVHTENTSSALIMNKEFSRDSLEDGGDFLIHVSKKSVPSTVWAKQLLSILKIQQNYVFPYGYAVMESDSQDDYKQIFESVKSLIPHFQIRKVITSEEHNLRTAIRSSFPAAELFLSLHHYQESMYKMIVKYNALRYLVRQQGNPDSHEMMDMDDDDFDDDDDDESEEKQIRKLLLSLLSLPLLPARKINETYIHLINATRPQNLRAIRHLLDEFERKWLERVGSETMSCYMQLELATQAFAEYESILKVRIGDFPETWKFPEGIAKLQKRVTIDNRILNDPELKTLIQMPKIERHPFSIDIRRLWDDFDRNNEVNNIIILPVKEFLIRASYLSARKSISYFGMALENLDLNLENAEEEEGEADQIFDEVVNNNNNNNNNDLNNNHEGGNDPFDVVIIPNEVEMNDLQNPIEDENINDPLLDARQIIEEPRQQQQQRPLERPVQENDSEEEEDNPGQIRANGRPLLCCTCVTATPVIVHTNCGHIPFCENCYNFFNENFRRNVEENTNPQRVLVKTCPICRVKWEDNKVINIFYH